MQKELNNNILEELIRDTYKLINILFSIDENRFIPLKRLLLNFESDPWWDTKRKLIDDGKGGIVGVSSNKYDTKDFLESLTPKDVIIIYSEIWAIELKVYELVHSDRINDLEIPEYIINGLTMISDESHDLFLKYANQC